jgi:hypothetical protein
MFQQVTTLTGPQRDLLTTLEIPTPKQVITLNPRIPLTSHNITA